MRRFANAIKRASPDPLNPSGTSYRLSAQVRRALPALGGLVGGAAGAKMGGAMGAALGASSGATGAKTLLGLFSRAAARKATSPVPQVQRFTSPTAAGAVAGPQLYAQEQ